MSVETSLLGPEFAVAYPGIDLSQSLDDETFEMIRHAWLANKVAVCCGERLSEDELVRFRERFARSFVHLREQFHAPSRPEHSVRSPVDARVTVAFQRDDVEGGNGFVKALERQIPDVSHLGDLLRFRIHALGDQNLVAFGLVT